MTVKKSHNVATGVSNKQTTTSADTTDFSPSSGWLHFGSFAVRHAERLSTTDVETQVEARLKQKAGNERVNEWASMNWSPTEMVHKCRTESGSKWVSS